jgi:hypothetical protein
MNKNNKKEISNQWKNSLKLAEPQNGFRGRSVVQGRLIKFSLVLSLGLESFTRVS